MAQLPHSELQNNNESLMDEIKVNPESKQPTIDNDFCDNDSLQNHADDHDYNDNNIHHTVIQNRDSAPEPPSSLTMALLQHHDNENPPQSMLVGTNLIQQQQQQQNSTENGTNNNANPNPLNQIGLSNIINSNNVPDMLIQPLIEMGFDRAKAIYALQQSERDMGSMSIDYAISWLFEHPHFIPSNTTNITNTIGNMLGNEFLNNSNDNTATNTTNNNNIIAAPPNNSPNNKNNNGNDNFALYNLIENISNPNPNSKPKSNRIYKHNETIGSAATDEKIDHKNIPTNTNANTSSTVASELSVLSTVENNITNNTKDTITQLYKEQELIDNINKNNINENMIPNDLKMVIIVRKDLKMSHGKIAAQCCHACLGVVLDIINMQYTTNNNNLNGNNNNLYDLKSVVRLWRMNGEKKIILQCLNETKLLQFKDKALINNLPHYLVCDAGHTQVKSGTKTVLAIGPYPSIEIDKITKELKLY